MVLPCGWQNFQCFRKWHVTLWQNGQTFPQLDTSLIQLILNMIDNQIYCNLN